MGGWNVVKLGSIAIVTATFRLPGDAHITTPWGSAYESERFALPDYPIAFGAVPWSSVEYVSADGGGGAAFVERTPSTITSANPGFIQFLRPDSIATLGRPVVAITAMGAVQ